MNPVLLLPVALAALAALILPLLIHLARRSEQRPTDFAALRWLRQRPKPRHRIRFDEWPLLLLRLLLLALLALWLARPALFGAQDARPWVVVAPGGDVAAALREAQRSQAQARWLAPGFARLDQPMPATRPATASMLRELDASLPAGVAVSVYVPARLSGIDGGRLRLSRPLQWRVGDDTAAAPEVAASPRAASPAAPLIRYAPSRAEALPYLRAVLAAWTPNDAQPAPVHPDTIAPVERGFDPRARAVIWLAPGAVPDTLVAWVGQGGSVLIDADSRWPGPALTFGAPLWRDADGTVRVEAAAVGRGRVLRLTGPLSPRAWPAMLQAGFVHGMRELFEPPAAQPSIVRARDYSPVTGAASFALPPMDLRPWLALLIALLFLAERWLATGARRGAGP